MHMSPTSTVSTKDRPHKEGPTLGHAPLAVFDGHTSLSLLLLFNMRALPGPLCSLSMLLFRSSPCPHSLSLLTCILDLLSLLPLLSGIQHLGVIMSIHLVGLFISHP